MPVLVVGLVIAVALVLLGRVSTVGATGSASGNVLVRGRMLFQNVSRDNFRCGFCHTLRSAKTQGKFAVNLDDEFTLDRKHGWSETTIRNEVLYVLRKPTCFEPNNPNRCMPSRMYSGAEARAVATFVARCAGRSFLRGCRPVAGGLRGEAGRGERVYATNGCAFCHWSANKRPVGPTLDGLAGSRVPLANGRSVVADDAYLLESILVPDAKIVKGYPRGFMSSRLPPGTISDAQAKELIAYIKTLR